MSIPDAHRGFLPARIGAALALLLCAVLGPIQSVIWNGPTAPAWVAALAGALAPALRGTEAVSALAQPTAEYFFYGRWVAVVYAGLLVALWCRPLPRSSRIGRALVALLIVAACGDFLAYWVSAVAGPSLRKLGFWYIEVPALAAVSVVSSALGISEVRAGTRPRSLAWCFAAVAPLALVSTASLRYLPHGVLLPLTLAVAARAFAPLRARGLQIAAAVLVSSLVGAALVFVPYRPVVVEGAPSSSAVFALTRPVAGVKLHVFNTGMNRMSELLVGRNRPWRPAPAFVIEHPTRGLIVFDCGLSEAVARDGEAALPIPLRWLFESRGRPGRTLDAQMREVGLEPGAVSFVVISHLHDDHTGAAPAFTNASFVGGPGTRGHLDGLDERWREVEALDLLGDGSIAIVPGGGHAREDLMLLLALPEGPVLLAGDAVVHRDWLTSDDVQRIAVDAERAAAVRNQVRALLAESPGVVLFPGHDLADAPRARPDIVLHSPEWFAVAAWPVSP